jgi:hypothetical protein
MVISFVSWGCSLIDTGMEAAAISEGENDGAVPEDLLDDTTPGVGLPCLLLSYPVIPLSFRQLSTQTDIVAGIVCCCLL